MVARQTIVFGLDGVCFDIVQPWLDDDRLPTLEGLIRDGGRSNLESCVPATTPPAWTSVTTGVDPGSHGIFGFYSRQPGEYDIEPVSDVDVRTRRLWDYTTEADLTSLVVNVPVTHPAREIQGAIVPGYLAPENPATYPEGLLADLDVEYQVYADSAAADVPEAQLRDEWLSLTESRGEIALALMDRYEWDLLFVEFQKTDGAVHKFDDETNVRKIYEQVDACMGRILDAVDDDPNVFVVSDHGIGQPKEWAVALNTWFVDAGYAETAIGATATDDKSSWLTDATERGNANNTVDSSDPPLSTRVLSGLSRLGVTKQRLERSLSAVGLYELATRVAPEGAGSGLGEEVVDKAASTAFYQGMGFSGVDVGVTINDERFYDEGTISAAEYDTVRSELMTDLRSLKGPDGQRPFMQVRPREAVYDGAAVELAPDIILEQAADYVIGSSKPRGQTFIPTEPGRIDHTRHGLLVAAGPDIESGWSLEGTPSITDVTPTLLALFGVPLAERFDGDVLAGTLAGDFEVEIREYDSLEKADEHRLSDAEAAALEERLKGMGYLE